MIRDFYSDESGQGMVEYGLLIALISIAAIIALKALGPAVSGMFDEATTALDEVSGG